MTIRIIDTSRKGGKAEVAELLERLRGGGLVAEGTPSETNVRQIVADTIRGVIEEGDGRIIADTAKLHGVELAPQRFRVSEDEIADAYQHVSKDERIMAIIGRAIQNVRRYQQKIMDALTASVDREDLVDDGHRRLGLSFTPVKRLGVYVPGGRAVYPSSLIMTAAPAQAAGVEDIAVVTPPAGDGGVDPLILATAHQLGLREIYRVSGVDGLAALAYGTQSIAPPVDMIVGPGNAFIAEAKRQLFGRVGIDSIAGPSEVLIIADGSASPPWVAADMLAQAEHAPGAAVLVTDSNKMAEAVAAEIDKQLSDLERADDARLAIEQYSAIVVVSDMAAACATSNEFAPEHLQVMVADEAEQGVLSRLRNAGAIFVGQYTPVPLGDYYAGPSHVLPTGATARFSSALSCMDFLKSSSIIRYDAEALNEDGQDVAEFARREGLTAHSSAIEIRSRD